MGARSAKVNRQRGNDAASGYLVRPTVALEVALWSRRYRPCPGNGGAMFTYRLHTPDGDDIGEAAHPDRVKIGEEPSSAAAGGSGSSTS